MSMSLAALPRELCWALNARVRQPWSATGVQDQAAKFLAQLLRVNRGEHQSPRWERDYLQRSQWFDRRCSDFFAQHPKGLCIDLGAGLSTRFHRLSQQADWPCFRWVDVDLPSVIALKSGVMPAIDNYQLISANFLQDDWLAQVNWLPHEPIIITLEAVLAGVSERKIERLLACLLAQLNACKAFDSSPCIRLVFDISAPPNGMKRWFGRVLGGGLHSLLTRLDSIGLKILSAEVLPGHAAWGLVTELNCTTKNKRSLG